MTEFNDHHRQLYNEHSHNHNHASDMSPEKSLKKLGEYLTPNLTIALLGPGEVGKSTLFKQYRFCFPADDRATPKHHYERSLAMERLLSQKTDNRGASMSENEAESWWRQQTTLSLSNLNHTGPSVSKSERSQYTSTIYNNVLVNLRYLVNEMKSTVATNPLTSQFYHTENEGHINEICDLLDNNYSLIIDNADHYTHHYYEMVHSIVNDPHFAQFITENDYAHEGVPDGFWYFVRRVHSLKEPPYFVPDWDSIMHSRRKTTGIVNIDRNYLDRISVTMALTGGQRSERKKWVNLYDSYRYIVYVASLVDFNRVLYEDDVTNRMVDSLSLFSELVQSDLLSDKPILLVLNKRDILCERFENLEQRKTIIQCISQLFPTETLDDDASVEDVIHLITKQYTDIYERFRAGKLIVLETSAVNTNESKQTLERIIEHFEEIEIERTKQKYGDATCEELLERARAEYPKLTLDNLFHCYQSDNRLHYMNS